VEVPIHCLCLQEYVDGQLKNKYGDAFIRGNNGKNLGHTGRLSSASHGWVAILFYLCLASSTDFLLCSLVYQHREHGMKPE
jgi:hypothetical protein